MKWYRVIFKWCWIQERRFWILVTVVALLLQPTRSLNLDWKRSSGWLESWEGLLLVTDVSTTYKQLHGTAMGSPVSVVVAEIVMQSIEEQALATETLPLWLRYVDDTITAVHENKIDEFHEHLNEQNTNIQCTKEIEENDKIPLLDCLVTRENNTLRTTVYRKPTHSDRLLDQTSYNPTSHKATTVRTLTRRAQIVSDSDNSLTDEIKHLNTVFAKNNYNTDFIKRNTYIRPNDSSNNSYTTTATIPYIRDISETIARILRPYNIRVAHKPILLYDAYSLTLREKTNRKTDQEQFIRSTAPTARPLI